MINTEVSYKLRALVSIVSLALQTVWFLGLAGKPDIDHMGSNLYKLDELVVAPVQLKLTLSGK